MASITFLETWQEWLEGWAQLGLSKEGFTCDHSCIVVSGNQTFYMAAQGSTHCIGKQSLMSVQIQGERN